MAFTGAHNFEIYHSTLYSISGNQSNVNIVASDALTRYAMSANPTAASYNSAERYPPPRCAPGTREQIIGRIRAWASGSGDQRLLWLRGMMGVGKSAIAQTVAEHFADQGNLGATFFFARGDAERGSARRLFAALAYELAIAVPALREPINAILNNDPAIINRSLEAQQQRLIVEPMRWAGAALPGPQIIVIDGLDECDDPNAVQDILRLISSVPPECQLRFIITSRPEFYIEAAFRSLRLGAFTQTLDANDVWVHDDIRIFVNQRFDEIRVKHELPESWPPEGAVDWIVSSSRGLFIYPATLLDFIDDPYERPDQRLIAVLEQSPRTAVSPYKSLDKLYEHILHSASVKSQPNTLKVFRAFVFGKFTTLQYLSDTLNLDSCEIRLALRGLRHFLKDFVVPSLPHEFIGRPHDSLVTFVSDAGRSNSAYYMNPAVQHCILLTTCLRQINRCRRRSTEHSLFFIGVSTGLLPPPAYQVNDFVHDRQVCNEYADALQEFTTAAVFDSILVWVQNSTASILYEKDDKSLENLLYYVATDILPLRRNLETLSAIIDSKYIVRATLSRIDDITTFMRQFVTTFPAEHPWWRCEAVESFTDTYPNVVGRVYDGYWLGYARECPEFYADFGTAQRPLSTYTPSYYPQHHIGYNTQYMRRIDPPESWLPGLWELLTASVHNECLPGQCVVGCARGNVYGHRPWYPSDVDDEDEAESGSGAGYLMSVNAICEFTGSQIGYPEEECTGDALEGVKAAMRERRAMLQRRDAQATAWKAATTERVSAASARRQMAASTEGIKLKEAQAESGYDSAVEGRIINGVKLKRAGAPIDDPRALKTIRRDIGTNIGTMASSIPVQRRSYLVDCPPGVALWVTLSPVLEGGSPALVFAQLLSAAALKIQDLLVTSLEQDGAAMNVGFATYEGAVDFKDLWMARAAINSAVCHVCATMDIEDSDMVLAWS